MTTNQQIDRILATLYDYQVMQKLPPETLPTYETLCKNLFDQTNLLPEKHYQNLLYMLVSKRLVIPHAPTLAEAFTKPISLRPEVVEWYGEFHSYLDYLQYLEHKNQPKAFAEDWTDETDTNPEVTGKGFINTIPVWVKVIVLLLVLAGIAFLLI